jgi:hypothetical protein
VLGVGEGPFSLPSSPTRRGILQLGIRRTGSLTNYLFDHITEGDEVGIRGPLGNGFPIEMFEGQDMLLVAGGLGMVPLRGLLQYLIDQRERFGKVMLLYGTRSPEQVLFREELESLSRRGDAKIQLSVDSTEGKPWAGRVGVVTELLDLVEFDVSRIVRRRVRTAGVLQVHAREARGEGLRAPPDRSQPGAPHGVRGRKVRALRGRVHVHLPARAGVLVLGRHQPARADLHVRRSDVMRDARSEAITSCSLEGAAHGSE